MSTDFDDRYARYKRLYQNAEERNTWYDWMYNLDDDGLKELWKHFQEIPCAEDNSLQEDFVLWPMGTNRSIITHWFDCNFSQGIKAAFGLHREQTPYILAFCLNCGTPLYQQTDEETIRYFTMSMPPDKLYLKQIHHCPHCKLSVDAEQIIEAHTLFEASDVFLIE